jgi:choline dehydrogenase-like flavoprotein
MARTSIPENDMAMQEYDYIIIGAGSAGCVLANKLSGDPDVSVLLIEAGKKDNFPLMKVPGYANKLLHSQYSWAYQTVPQKHLNDRVTVIPQGKVLGGSSSINGMIYIRGNPLDYRHWRQLGNRGWDWEDVLPYFIALENNAERSGALHGNAGPLHVGDIPTPHRLSYVFLEAAKQAGIPLNPDFNGPEQEGAGIFQSTRKGAFRWSAASAFIKPILGRANLTVTTRARVARVIIDKGRATGVDLREDNGVRSVANARREVIVSSGAIGSPRLMLLSGIGPADELRDVGVEVHHDLPGVGKNFHDHIDISSVFHSTATDTYDRQDSFLPSMVHGLRMLLTGKGPATSVGVEGCAYVRSHPSVSHPDISLHFLPLYVVEMAKVRMPGHGITMMNNLIRPKSRGSVTLASPDIDVPPLVDPNYLEHPDDMRVMIECVKWARRIMSTDALAPYISGEMLPGIDVQTDDDIAEYVRNTAQTDFHPVGSCKMGNDKMAVVDDRLRVHGLEGLRVIDSSVMPSVVSGNTNAPTMMIGAKGADFIRYGEAAPDVS